MRLPSRRRPFRGSFGGRSAQFLVQNLFRLVKGIRVIACQYGAVRIDQNEERPAFDGIRFHDLPVFRMTGFQFRFDPSVFQHAGQHGAHVVHTRRRRFFACGQTFVYAPDIGDGFGQTQTLFSFITLPVEINASQRALVWLSKAGITNSYNHHAAEDALRSAAYTYVVAALSSLATLIYYIMIYMGRRD